MSTLSYMKSVRTRYRNTLFTEIQEANSILNAEISAPRYQEYVLKSAKCVEKLKVYVSKLEIQSSKVASSLEEDQDATADKIAEEDCKLCADATDCYLEVEHYKERLVKVIKTESEENVDKFNASDIVQLHKDMKDIVQTQLKQQEELLKSQQRIENPELNVKLPKIDMISFHGDKTKWNEFWDSFETTIDKNKRLSNIDKFNYLKSKLGGDAKYAISGLNVSHENYTVAVNILKERYGNVQDVIDLHYSEMINLQCPSNKTSSLRLFLDKVNRHLRSLEVLKQSVDQDILVSMVKSKLPEEVLLQLEIQKGPKEKWYVRSMCERLKDYVVAREKSDKKEVQRERLNSDGTKFNSFTKPKQHHDKHSRFNNGARQTHRFTSAEALVVTGDDKGDLSYFDKCRYCQQKHWSDECYKYKTIEERKAKLKGSCYKCLRPSHKASECKKGKLCVHCGELNKHHRSLCPQKFGSRVTSVHLSEERDNTDIIETETKEFTTNLSGNTENVLISSGEIVLMQTAKVEVKYQVDSVKKTTRLMFDSGSQRTYISQELASNLNLKPEKEEMITVVTFGSDKPRTVKTTSTSISIKMNNGKFFKISANIVPVISGNVQRRRIDTSSIENVRHFVKDVELADDIPIQHETSSIDLLIGNDHYFDFILGERLEIQPGLYLLASKVGWILTGKTKEIDEVTPKEESSFFIMSHTGFKPVTSVPKTDACITSMPDLTDMWNLESIGITDQEDSSEDERAMQSFKDTITYSEGRYYVKWPWKKERLELPVNRELALCRFKSCIARMKRKPELLEKYNSVIQDQLEKGIVEKIDETISDGATHYIPHHAVITPHKSTTKLRIVYDASAKPNKEANSLNECLHRGPVLLRNLCGIFMRFRLHKIAVVADIEKAFLQVGLQISDRDVTRFLWIKNFNNPLVSENNIEVYRFCRVPFGIISSPFLLAATIETHIDSYQTPIAEKIKNNIYVDNLISGSDSVSEIMEFYSESKQIFKTASMNLREWISNNQAVNELLPCNDKIDVFETNVLGHIWNTDLDVISVKPTNNTICHGQSTKRKTLTELAEVFDPLGLFSPVVVRGKIFLQDLWKRNLKWDDELCDEDKCKWVEISADLKRISEVSISRCIKLNTESNPLKYKILCFCDASARAYSTVIYLHQTNGKQSKCDLIFSKSRLSPIKGMTIPRLELMAVLIGVRSLEFVKSELNLEIEEINLWTDSQCVLKWLSTTKSVGVFVKNRIREIKNHKDVNFLYVSTKENPADIASRGTSVNKLRKEQFWWHGPEWITKSDNCWKRVKIDESDVSDEQVEQDFQRELTPGDKQKEITLISGNADIADDTKSPFGIDIRRFSSYNTLIRVTAWINRFVSKVKKLTSNSGKSLSLEEINKAEKMWIYCVQRSSFSDVFNSISSDEKNNLKSQLGIFMDDDSVLRCRGRLENAELSEFAKCPERRVPDPSSC